VNRAKGLVVILVLSLVSAVSLRLLVERATRAMDPQRIREQAPPRVTRAELERRFAGCGRFRFAFDSLGYSSRQWPSVLVAGTPLEHRPAVFVARGGRLVAVDGDTLAGRVGRYSVGDTAVAVHLGPDTALVAVLAPRGDSLAGSVAMRRPDRGRGVHPVGRAFLETPVPRPVGCDAALPEAGG
jgi:hypothetical protein